MNCPKTNHKCSYAYRHLDCRCVDCVAHKRAAEDPILRNKSNRNWRNAHPEYVCFERMKYRCNNPNGDNWHYYGGRGIKVLLSSWHDIVDEIGQKPGVGYSVDRINNDGHYERGNIRWATVKEQNNNRRKPCKTLSRRIAGNGSILNRG